VIQSLLESAVVLQLKVKGLKIVLIIPDLKGKLVWLFRYFILNVFVCYITILIYLFNHSVQHREYGLDL